MTKCTCQSLKQFARDPEISVFYDEASENYVLRLTSEFEFPLAYCWFCGGQGAPHRGKDYCKCGLIARWAADPNLPVEFDEKWGQFNLLHDFCGGKVNGKLTIYYCLACGGMMPETKHCDFFEEVTENDTQEFADRLDGLKTLEDAVGIFGQPQEVFGPLKFAAAKKEIYGGKDRVKGYRFSPPGKKVDIHVSEMEDGKLEISFSGRRKTVEGKKED